MNDLNDLDFDRQHIWHPYTSMLTPSPTWKVTSAQGVYLYLDNNERLIDGMSSWWSAIFGYNHPQLNQAIIEQTQKMSHVMFGGLTHDPAIQLCRQLIDITPSSLQHIFLADSGSVSVEVALKMAWQYWLGQDQPQKCKIATIKRGYHGDTLAAMSLSDPDNSLHGPFSQVLPQQLFVSAPKSRFAGEWFPEDIQAIEQLFSEQHHSIAAFILEPIVQGAGGMHFYHPEFLRQCRQLCDDYHILLIADEIATGFGRTGCLFACEHAQITPDILCLGKALTAGYMTLAATICTTKVANTIGHGEVPVLMHGPTFMGNPLACAVANQSLSLLKEFPWQQRINVIAEQLTQELSRCQSLSTVKEVRVLGAIGVVELHHAVALQHIQPLFVGQGVWIRPFGRLVYIMPPYIITSEQLTQLTQAIYQVVSQL